MRENPGMADWWITQERNVVVGGGAPFITEHSYAQLADQVDRQGFLFEDDGEEYDAECGLVCAGETA